MPIITQALTMDTPLSTRTQRVGGDSNGHASWFCTSSCSSSRWRQSHHLYNDVSITSLPMIHWQILRGSGKYQKWIWCVSNKPVQKKKKTLNKRGCREQQNEMKLSVINISTCTSSECCTGNRAINQEILNEAL